MSLISVIVIIGLYYLLRNAIASLLYHLAGGRIDMDHARLYVGRVFWWFFFALWVVYVAVLWKLGIFSAYGKALGVIFHAFGDLIMLVPRLIWELLTA